ncbi:UNVERIFIED_ORG: hypothetical protein FHW05_001061 [Pantoea agglomerans]
MSSSDLIYAGMIRSSQEKHLLPHRDIGPALSGAS